MIAKRLAEVMIDKLPEETGSDFVDRLCLRIFSVPAILTFFRDIKREGDIVEMSFFMLPEDGIEGVKNLIGKYPTEVYNFKVNGRNMTGFKFDISSLKDKQDAEENRDILPS